MSTSAPDADTQPSRYISNASGPCVHLYVPLPGLPGERASRWSSSPVVKVPLLAIKRLTLPPFLWVTYAGYAICGRVHGILSRSTADPPEQVPLDGVLTEDNIDLYFHANAAVQLCDHKAQDVASTHFSLPRNADFQNAVKSRDSGRCLFTEVDIEGTCNAIHLARHNKGDEARSHT